MLETDLELLPTGPTRLISHHAPEVMLLQAVLPLAGIILVLLDSTQMPTVPVGVLARTVVVVGLHVDLVTGSGGTGNISQDRPIPVLSVNFLVSLTILQSCKPGLISQITMTYLWKHLVRKFRNPSYSSPTLRWTIIYYRTSSLLATRHRPRFKNILFLL